MNRHGNLAGVLALSAALLLSAQATAENPELKKENLSRDIQDLKDEVTKLSKLQRLNNLATNAELRLLNERLERIENALMRLAPPTPRISSSFTPGALPATGTLRLDNRLAVTATVYVDGVPYSVPPFTVRTLANRPAGGLVYEATAEGRGMGAPVRSSLGSNETLTVTIY